MILHHGLLCGAMIICLRMFDAAQQRGFVQVTSLSSTTLYSTKLTDKKLLSEVLELGQARYQYETKQRETISGEWSKESWKNENHSLLIPGWMPEVKVVSSSLIFHERNSTQLRGKSHPGSQVIHTVQIVSLMVCFHVYSHAYILSSRGKRLIGFLIN